MFRDEIVKKSEPLIKKAKDKGYSENTLIIMGFLAFGSHNDGNEETTITVFNRLTDESSDEHEFLKKATRYLDF